MMSPGCSATMPTTICDASWIANCALVVAMVVLPETRLTSISRPKPGGCT